MARPKSDVQRRIMDTIERQLRHGEGASPTLDAVAEEAGCAKGLINYHFRTKSELIAAAARRLLETREAKWKSALGAPDPEAAIQQTWELMIDEVENGFWRAWSWLVGSTDKLTVQTVSRSMSAFNDSVSASLSDLLDRTGLASTVPAEELGHLVSATVHGLALQLSRGVPRPGAEAAYNALWAGILSLTEPRRR